MEQFDRLVQIVAQLRGPEGCPWDREQDHASLKQYFVEEVYEALEAIDGGDEAALCGELGDVLLQVLLHVQIAAEQGRFTLADVLDRISEKLIYRHPHVFADVQVADSAEVLRNWEQLKRHETPDRPRDSALEGVPHSLPALQGAQELQKRAARVGFDWEDIAGPWAKLAEEIEELRQVAETGAPAQVEHELGDVLIAVVNLARFLGVMAEEALRRANRRFAWRFREVERLAEAQGSRLAEMSLAEMDELWEQAKAAEADAT
jgi:tetrapyrrole methylase family protein/MazG family protein